MSVLSTILAVAASAAAVSACSGPEHLTGDFDTSLRSEVHMYEMPAVNPNDYACRTGSTKICMLPSYSTCLIEYATEHAHCDIMYNGSKDVNISAKNGNCAVRCYNNLVGVVSGEFDVSKRTPEQTTEEHVMADPTRDEYSCITGLDAKRCMLPSFSTCFIVYHTEEAHCDILYGNTSDIQLIAKNGNCRARCFDLTHDYAKLALPLISGDFDTSGRYPPHSGEGFSKAEDRNGEEYQCITADAKRCMLPSGATCFLTYITEYAHCDILYNGTKDAYISAKNGNCSYRCFDLRTASPSGAGRRLLALENEL